MDALGFIAPIAAAAVTGGALAPVLKGALTTAGATAPTVLGSTALGTGVVKGGAVGGGAMAQKLTEKAFEKDPKAPGKQSVQVDAATTAKHILGGMSAAQGQDPQQMAQRTTQKYDVSARLRQLIGE